MRKREINWVKVERVCLKDGVDIKSNRRTGIISSTERPRCRQIKDSSPLPKPSEVFIIQCSSWFVTSKRKFLHNSGLWILTSNWHGAGLSLVWHKWIHRLHDGKIQLRWPLVLHLLHLWKIFHLELALYLWRLDSTNYLNIAKLSAW